MWKMPNFRRLGLFKYINCRARDPEPEGAVRFEIRDWGHFLGRGIKSPVPFDSEVVVYILLNFVKFLKK